MTRKAVWGISPEASDTPFESVEAIERHLSCHPVIARVLWNRGMRSPAVLQRLFAPELAGLPDPMLLIDMEKAVSRAADAVLGGEKIAIYGDYDVDGTCGASILSEFFRSLGVEPVIYQPDRFSEGYGVNTAAVTALVKQGARLIISVDCGITAVEQAKVIRELGGSLIVLDHHKMGPALPDAVAVVDPQRPEDTSGLTNLCGAGLAFFFSMGLRAELRRRGFFNGGSRPEPNLMRLLDLVAIATVADMVDLRGVNRILVTHGLRVMGTRPRVGIKAILEAARVTTPTAMHCGFVLGPRINAAGRLKHARAAFELLTSSDDGSARALAAELEQINTARKLAQEGVYQQARAQAVEILNDPRWKVLADELSASAAPAVLGAPWPRALVLAAPPPPEDSGITESLWHEGVVGIVASKITEEFGRPAFVLAVKEGKDGDAEILKGSVRSMGKIDILSAISSESVARHLLNFGGHSHAGGVSLRRSELPAFIEALNRHMAVTLGPDEYRRERRADAEVRLEEIDARLVDELRKLEPFGMEFPEPVLKVVGACPTKVQILKEKHLKMRFEGKSAVEAVWFNAFREERVTLELDEIRSGGPCSLWVSPQWNEWQGVRRLQLQVRHAELER